MRVRVRGTLSRVKARAGALRSSHGSPPWLRLLPLACIIIIIVALGILAISESKGIVFKMEPLLRRNALSVELWAQIVLNRVRGRLLARTIEKEQDVDRVEFCQPFPLPDCPKVPPEISRTVNVQQWLHNRNNSTTPKPSGLFSTIGGTWRPPHCTSRHSIAVIIPYRNRKNQLDVLLDYLPPLLQRQQVNYRIFVVEQIGNDTYNKGILMNAGFLTALEMPSEGVTYHCFIFHDVDLLLEDERNMYTCPQQPRHLSVAVNELGYKLPYRILVGGVFAIRTEHFLRVNGYSNLYWGWGGEDDDMGYRVEHVMSSISRPPEWIARYTMLKHDKRRPLSRKVRMKLLRTSWRRYRLDGLNTVQYGLGDVIEKDLFTHVFIDVGPPPNSYRIIEEEESVKNTK
ncbi:beta-1,4-galactosyltransferase 4-like isoform X2 [Cimex lectularius]|uniref:Beta-1,4-N-acetylgalactosaminyltransferase n=1 Tax=Cimex lectularius TaxID=79782 RepID=A0A8I6RPR7_CIMLE|nr:beta-1,4-galactosyltransferase 4-like isoform X2 [Cimex lectularius]XP_014250267.1 beta-1,4-galactosyltransferase 4-like isoform X2 [Cimex lectularius]